MYIIDTYECKTSEQATDSRPINGGILKAIALTRKLAKDEQWYCELYKENGVFVGSSDKGDFSETRLNKRDFVLEN